MYKTESIKGIYFYVTIHRMRTSRQVLLLIFQINKHMRAKGESKSANFLLYGKVLINEDSEVGIREGDIVLTQINTGCIEYQHGDMDSKRIRLFQTLPHK